MKLVVDSKEPSSRASSLNSSGKQKFAVVLQHRFTSEDHRKTLVEARGWVDLLAWARTPQALASATVSLARRSPAANWREANLAPAPYHCSGGSGHFGESGQLRHELRKQSACRGPSTKRDTRGRQPPVSLLPLFETANPAWARSAVGRTARGFRGPATYSRDGAPGQGLVRTRLCPVRLRSCMGGVQGQPSQVANCRGCPDRA